MSISTIQITQGAGTAITVDTSATGDMQVIKLAESVLGSTNLIPSTVAAGLLVNVSAVAGTVAVVNNGANKIVVDASQVAVPITDNSASLTVDAPAATPLAVRLSTGAAFIDTIPVSLAGTSAVSGTVSIGNTPAVTQSGTWNIGTVATITNPVTVTGTVAISGTTPVSGTVTGNQGTAAAVGAAWPIKITDATNTSSLQNIGGIFCVPVKVLGQTGGGYSQQDKTAFTEATTFVEVVGGVYNDAFAGSPAAGQNSTVRITAFRAFHSNLRNNSGGELGIPSAPLQTQNAPSGGTGGAVQAPWKSHVAYTASQTAQAIRTPTAGKISFIEGFIITPNGAGVVTIYDSTDSATTRLYKGTTPISGPLVFMPARPIPLAAVNDILAYTTGAGATGDIVAWGYEA